MFFDFHQKIFSVSHLIHYDRLENAKKLLNEFRNMDDTQKVRAFETHLQPAITGIYELLKEEQLTTKLPDDFLATDYLYCDIRMIPYYNAEGKIVFEMLKNAKKLDYPTGEYKVIDKSKGIYLQDDTQLVSKRIAIDYSLTTIATRWYNEIDTIHRLLQKNEEE